MAKTEKISIGDNDYFFLKNKKKGKDQYKYVGRKIPTKAKIAKIKFVPPTHKNIIPVLQEIQEKFQYLPEEELVRVSKELDIPATDVMSVATFYSQFKFEMPAKYKIQVCDGTACHVRGSKNILGMLEKELNIKPGETTHDGLFAIEIVRCLGVCASAPLMMVNDKLHPKLDQTKTKEIIDRLKEEAKNGN